MANLQILIVSSQDFSRSITLALKGNLVKIETVAATISVIFLAVAIYLAILSSQVYETQLKMQLVDWAVYSLIGGISVLLCWLLFMIMKRIFQDREVEEEISW